MMTVISDRWATLSMREQRLLQGLAGIIAALILWYGIVTPLLAAHREAEFRLTAAKRQALEIAQAARLSAKLANDTGREPARAPRPDNRSLRQIVSDTTQANGLTLSRLQPNPDAGGLTLWLDNVEASSLLRWMKLLYEDHGITAHRVAIQRGEGTAVRAQLSLRASDD